MKVKEKSEKVGLKLNIQKTKIMASGPITSWQIDGETVETVSDFILEGSKITADVYCSHEIKRRLLLGRKAMTNLDSILKSRDITNKGPSRQSYGFSSSHVWMWKLDHEESWVPKNWCFWTVVLEKTLESTMDCKKTKPFNPKWNHPWTFTRRTVVEAEAPILWPPDMNSWFIGKDPGTGKKSKRKRWQQRMRWLNGLTNSMNTNLGKLRGVVRNKEAWCVAVHGVTNSPTWLDDQTTATSCITRFLINDSWPNFSCRM